MNIFRRSAKVSFWISIFFLVLFAFLKVLPQLILLVTILYAEVVKPGERVANEIGMRSLIFGLSGIICLTYYALFSGWRAGYIQFGSSE